MVLPVLVLIWAGVLYVNQTARHVTATHAAARSAAWAHAFGGCQAEGSGTEDCAQEIALDLAPTGAAQVDDASGSALGEWSGPRADASFERPLWFGGGERRFRARVCVPCNPVPKDSLAVIRRTYEAQRTDAARAE